MTDPGERLNEFAKKHGLTGAAARLSADASTREYFRVDWKGSPAIACVYPEPFVAGQHPYVDVTELFRAADLPVAEIYAVDGELGVILQEDLGDGILRDRMAEAEPEACDRLRNEAISLIARIQLATPLAFERGSIASQLSFDKDKLLWELNYFKEHYFSTFRKRMLDRHTDRLLAEEFSALSAELAGRARVLCHRDFHAANLMLDHEGRMRIIDHQDARIGSAAYDLVSLLLDRITVPPTPEWLADRRRYFLGLRRTLGLPKIDEDEFAYEFRLQTLQRCLKAAGTFSYQSSMRGKAEFVPFIIPMFRITARSLSVLGRFPVMNEILTREIAAEDHSG